MGSSLSLLNLVAYRAVGTAPLHYPIFHYTRGFLEFVSTIRTSTIACVWPSVPYLTVSPAARVHLLLHRERCKRQQQCVLHNPRVLSVT